MNGWIALAGAIVAEVIGTTLLKESQSFTKLIPSIFTFLLYCLSFYLLSVSLKTIPMNVSYAIWAGAGTVLIAVIGVLLYKEVLSLANMAFMAMIIIGCVGLQLTSK